MMKGGKMKQHYCRQMLFCISLMLAIYLFMPTFLVFAQDPKTGQSNSQTDFQSPEEIDSHVAGMTDAQVRQAHAQKLKQDAEKRSASTQASEKGRSVNPDIDSFQGAAKAAVAVLKRFGGKDRSAIQWGDVVAKLSGGKGGPYLFGTLAGLAAIIALGLVMRWLFLRTTADIRQNLINAVRLGKLQFFGRVLSRMLLDAMGIGVYVLTTFILFAMIYREGKPSYDIVSVYLIVSYYILVLAFGARVIFSPEAASLRLFPMEDQSASFLYKWILRILFIVGFFAGISDIFRRLDVSSQLYLMMSSSEGTVVILALIIMIWQSRKRMGQAIWDEETEPESGGRPLRAAFAKNWHYFAIFCVLVAGGIWTAKA
jgi:hypothetical protein